MEFIQENSIEFLVQSIYLIYTRLVVCTQLYLTYFKSYMFYIRLAYSIYTIWCCQVQLTPKGKSPQSWLRNVQSAETLYNELSDINFLEQLWLQLMCYTIYLLCGCNFRELE